MPQVTSQQTTSSITIAINGITHFFINRTDIIGFQSWVVSKIFRKDYHIIEVYIRDSEPIQLEYDDIELWKSVIHELTTHLSKV